MYGLNFNKITFKRHTQGDESYNIQVRNSYTPIKQLLSETAPMLICVMDDTWCLIGLMET